MSTCLNAIELLPADWQIDGRCIFDMVDIQKKSYWRYNTHQEICQDKSRDLLSIPLINLTSFYKKHFSYSLKVKG